MWRIFSNPITALAAGLCLRLFFVLKYPANSGDTVLYEQMANNWLKHHVYAMDVGGAITPVDLRMPGYPAFLAIIYALTGRNGAAAHIWVMLAQIAVDLAGCLAIALLAAGLLTLADGSARLKPVLIGCVWLAALCPFTANYTAVLLTETFAIFLTSVALLFFVGLTVSCNEIIFPIARRPWEWNNDYRFWAIPLGLTVGIGTLFRPEAPLLLIAGWIANAFVLLPHRKVRQWVFLVLYTGAACALPLLPWAVRNAVTFHKVQFLAPKNSNLPGELVPYGFMAWEKTWLFRMKDCYLVPWKLNDEAIDVDSIPARAFDTQEEKQRVAEILEQYNTELTLTAEEDAAFAELARERTQRHPLRTYVWLPALRALTLWFTPRIELLPVSGHVFPLKQMRADDPVDQSVTAGLFLLNVLYVALALWGAWRLWRWNRAVRPAIAALALFVLLRTAFLTTLETPEPRYVLVCFPIVLAVAATLFGKPYTETLEEART
jgi:hypothetical protein